MTGKKGLVRAAGCDDGRWAESSRSLGSPGKRLLEMGVLCTLVIVEVHTSAWGPEGAGGPSVIDHHPQFAVDNSQAEPVGSGHLAPQGEDPESRLEGHLLKLPLCHDASYQTREDAGRMETQQAQRRPGVLIIQKLLIPSCPSVSMKNLVFLHPN